jgi:hypothetical protein
MGLFLPVDCRLEPLLDQPLADPQNSIDADGEALGDPGVCPGRPIRIGLQQDLGIAYLRHYRG